MTATLLSLSIVANALNRSLVLPPLPCLRVKRYCNVCSFDKVNCFKDVVSSFKNEVKESIFFLNSYVPERVRNEDRLNEIVSFEENCVRKEYRSSFPAHVGYHNTVKCVPCENSLEDCAIEFGASRNDTVLKLFSVYSCFLNHLFPNCALSSYDVKHTFISD